MQSIIKPLNKKVDVLKTQTAIILSDLIQGKPEATKEVERLWADVLNIKAEFSSTVSAMKASQESSIKTMAGMYNPSPMIPVLVFYVSEVIAAINLLKSLLELITSIATINTVLTLSITELEDARKVLNVNLIKLTHSVERAKQKTVKNIEWEKRKINAIANLEYLKQNKKALDSTLQTLQKNPKDNEKAIRQLNVQLDYNKIEENKNLAEKNENIPRDKKSWEAKWTKEEKEEKENA